MFITLEGIDGSGKSTQSKYLASWLQSRTGKISLVTYEPGGYPEGITLRKFILNSHGYSPMTDLLLFLADRSEHVTRVILPALRQGSNVICERYNASTIAYQSGGHKLNPAQVKRIIKACNFPVPDVEILLDITPEHALERISSRLGKPDKFEQQGLPLLKAVSRSYIDQASDNPKRFIRIDCDDKNEDEVFATITAKLEARICQSR